MATTARKRTRDTSTRRAKAKAQATPIRTAATVASRSGAPGRILRHAAMARRVADALLDAAGYDPRRVAAALRAAEDTLAEHPELLDAIRTQAPDAEPVDVMLALARQAMLRASATDVAAPAEAGTDDAGDAAC